MKFQEFKGNLSDLVSGRGRAELPETVMIKDALEASATQGGKAMEIVDLTKAEVTKNKSRIPGIAKRYGYSYRMVVRDNGIIISARFKEEKQEKSTAPPEPPKPTTAKPRRARKATA